MSLLTRARARCDRLTNRIINRSLGALSQLRHVDPEKPLRHPVIFIVGPPRSGTTLLYQALVAAFDVGFFANIHHRYYQAPAIIERIFHVANTTPTLDFASSYGLTKGKFAPSECGEFWYRFFRRSPHHVRAADVDLETVHAIRAEFQKLESITKRPFLVKNLPCGMRIEPIQAALPEALFLVVKRDLVDNAISILKKRQSLGSGAAWWSVQPPNLTQLKQLPVHEQAVRQITSIHAEINRCRSMTDRPLFLDIGYEDFCSDTSAILQQIRSFIRTGGCEIRNRLQIPPRFEISAGSMADTRERMLVQQFVSQQLPKSTST